jgi:hypothetical protein
MGVEETWSGDMCSILWRTSGSSGVGATFFSSGKSVLLGFGTCIQHGKYGWILAHCI